MKRVPMAVATAALVLLIGLKFLVPQVGAELRDRFCTAMEREMGYAEAFLQLNAGLDLQAETPAAPQATAQQQRPRFVYVSVTTAPTAEPSPTVEPSPTPTPEPTPEPLPAAVTAFLESQAAFADYELPEKADYS